MESYIPLVKAIIISTVLSWGTSSVVITDQYIFKETDKVDPAIGNKTKIYQIYDLRKNFIHAIDEEMKYRVSMSIDSLKFNYPNIRGSRRSPKSTVVGTSISKKKFDRYQCKLEINQIEGESFGSIFSEYSYFAKIAWLDDLLDTNDKREFAGFYRQEYSPYHYLIYEYEQYPDQEPKDLVLRVIEKSEVDTTIIHNLLSLPVVKDNGILRPNR
jgi:hypothetical protein